MNGADLVRQSVEVCAHNIPGAELGNLEAADDVLESRSHYKVLLLQSELLTLKKLQDRDRKLQAGA